MKPAVRQLLRPASHDASLPGAGAPVLFCFLAIVSFPAAASALPGAITESGSPVSFGPLSWLFLLIVLLIPLIAFVLALRIQVKAKTAELRAQNLQLEREVGSHKATEKSLRLYEMMFLEIISRNRDGFIRRAAEGQFIDANPVFFSMTGYTREDLQKMPMIDLFPPEWRNWKRFASLEEQLLEKGYTDQFVIEYLRKDGSIFPAEVRTYLVRDDAGNPLEVCSFIRDISQQLADENSLRNAITELEQILDTSADPMRVVDRRFRLVRVNQAFAEMVGKTKDELVGRDCREIFTDPHTTDLANGLEGLFSLQTRLRHDNALISIGERDFHCELTSTVIRDHDNRISGMVTDIHDVTYRRRMEEAIRFSETRFRAFFEASRDAIFIMDDSGTILDCNLAAQALFGTSNKDLLVGKDLAELSPLRQMDGRSSADKITEWLDSTQLVGSSFFEWHFRRSDSSVFPSEVLLGTLEISGVTFTQGVIRNISDRKLAENAREESEQRLELALDATDEGIWDWDLAHRKLYFSPRLYGMLGFAANDFDPTPESFLSLFHPEDHRRSGVHFGQFLEGKSDFFSGEVRFRTKDRQWLWVLCRGKAIHHDSRGRVERIVGTIVNIHELKAIEEALRKSEVNYRTLVESANSIILRTDTEGNVSFFNHYAEEFFGYRTEEVMGRSAADLLSGFRQKLDRLPFPILEEAAGISETAIITKSGDQRWVAWSNKAITTEDGELKEYLCMGQDITAKRRVEQKAREQQEQLVQADKMKSLGTLVAGVAHEINNPNSFIMLNTPILKEMWDEVVPVLQEYAQETGKKSIGKYPLKRLTDRVPILMTGIIDGSVRIKDIVANLKDFSRQEAGGKSQKIDVNDVVRAATDLVRNKIKQSTKNFIVDLTEGLPPVWGSFQKLEQVVINLMINSCEALSDMTQEVRVTTVLIPEAEEIELTVSDQGGGIPEEKIQQIFDPFFTTKREKGGTGLGLSISAGIIEEHGGTITFSSRVGEGTTATIRLPVDRRII